ncbi:MAG: LacI family transcriptional regulator [Candidatus Pacebacteria bacterium]|nr:LacI family transcriptional regulator [Candidatus Paceibacterota bacterium]
MITQKDIARDLDLSVGTVSKALRKRSDVGIGTRARVMEAAQRLGYHLPFHARADGGAEVDESSGKKLTRVGVFALSSPMVRWDRGGFVYEVLEGVSQAAELHEVFLSLHFSSKDQVVRYTHPASLPPVLKQRRLDGLITVLSFPEDVLAYLSHDFPCVTVNHEQPSGIIDCVAVNLMRDYENAVSRLVNLGHRCIGFFSSGRHVHSRRALGAYVTAVTQSGAEVNLEWAVDCFESGKMSNEERVDAAVRLSREAGVTAWLCRTSYLGVQLYEGFREAGLAVPEDVSIMVHSLESTVLDTTPALSGIAMPLRELGRQALVQLLARCATPKRPVQTLLLAGEFSEGTTLGRAPVS